MRCQNFEPLKLYPGNNSGNGEYHTILQNIPKCDLFIEVMCGSAFISSLVTGCNVHVNDIDEQLMQQHKENFSIADTSTIKFTALDYRALLSKVSKDRVYNAVFYFDVPYLRETRYRQRKLYKHDWSRSDHVEFLKIVNNISQSVMVLHPPCNLYNDALQDFRKIDFKVMTRGGLKDRCLYMNFPQPQLLQCWQYVGKNFTRRQQLKRIAERMIKRIDNYKDNERAAILSCVLDIYKFMQG